MASKSLLLLSVFICVHPWLKLPAQAQDKTLPAALVEMVETERAFARMSVEKGMREAFLAYFADDGINFQPHPVKTREAFRARPAPTTKPQFTLDWEPVYADMSLAGDLGYSTGPYLLTDQSEQKRPPRFGWFFSVWKKQSDGNWRVAVDMGVETQVPPGGTLRLRSGQATAIQAAPDRAGKPRRGRIDVEAERAALLELEREFSRESAKRGVLDAYFSFLGENPRLYRAGAFPYVGKDAIRSYLAAKPVAMTWEPSRSSVSASVDLGWTQGSYEAKDSATSQVSEKGYYVRVWKRQANGNWKFVVEVTNALPKEG